MSNFMRECAKAFKRMVAPAGSVPPGINPHSKDFHAGFQLGFKAGWHRPPCSACGGTTSVKSPEGGSLRCTECLPIGVRVAGVPDEEKQTV